MLLSSIQVKDSQTKIKSSWEACIKPQVTNLATACTQKELLKRTKHALHSNSSQTTQYHWIPTHILLKLN